MHSLFHPSIHPAAPAAAPARVHTSTDVAAGQCTPARRRFFDGQQVDAWGHTQLRDVRRREVQRLLATPADDSVPAQAHAKASLAHFVAVFTSSFVADAVLDVGGHSRDFLLHSAPAHTPLPQPPARPAHWWRAAQTPAPGAPPTPSTRSWLQQVDGALVRLALLPHETGQALCSAGMTGASWALAAPVALGIFALALGCTRVALREQSAEQALARQEQLQTLLGLEQRFGHVLGTDAWLAQVQTRQHLEAMQGSSTRRAIGLSTDSALA